jgi:hypothetical protein
MRVITLLLATVLLASPALAEHVAGFLGSSRYATEEGCSKLKKLAEGGDRNISTVPETLSAEGYSGWEHTCTFASISETVPGKSWKAVLRCEEGESTWEDTQVFEKTGEATFTVKADGEEIAAVYTVCDAPGAKQGN